MNRLFKISLFSLLLLATSCGEKTLIETNSNQPNNIWNTYKPVNFDINIADTSINYKVVLAIKMNANMQQKNIPIDVETSNPNGETRAFAKFLIMDSAKVVKDFSEFSLQNNKHFNEPGKYHYKITQRTPKFNLEGIETIGLRLKKADSKKETEE